jgi:predicted ATPase
MQQCRVVVVDDLQWGDPASVDLLIHLLSLTDEVPILFLCAFRPERQSPGWQVKVAAETDHPHRYTEIVLRPLEAADTDALVSALFDIGDLPAELRALVMQKTEGNPYFVEEVVRSLVEQGAVQDEEGSLRWKSGIPVTDIAIPDSLQALLMARIDRLDEEARSTLQMAAVIGRSFYYRILLAISDSAMSVDRHLRSLERVELLREAGRLPELEYIFRHELARDAAYGTILNRRRREFHVRVAEAIEKLFEGRLEEHAHRLAQHFELGGDEASAARYFELAGDVAASMDGRTEAAAHYRRAAASAKRASLDADVIRRIEAKVPGIGGGAESRRPSD